MRALSRTDDAPRPSWAAAPHDRVCEHVVQFYETHDFLVGAVADFLAEGLWTGQPLVVIATSEHREGIVDRLGSFGFDPGRALRSGRLRLLDAREALAGFMVGSLPDPARFRASVGAAISPSGGLRVRAYGEMVDVLWRDGNPDGALHLEELWNELERTHVFSLLCAYRMDGFHRPSDASGLEEVCARHSAVIPAEGVTCAGDDRTRALEVLRLQQRAHALGAELRRRVQPEAEAAEYVPPLRSGTDVPGGEAAREDLRRAREEAESASRVKSEFLAVMSHELRTPLNAIVGYGELLRHGVAGPLNAEQSVYLDRVRESAEQLLRLIEQVLSLSHADGGKQELLSEEFDLVATTREAVALLEPEASRKGVALRLRSPEELRCRTDHGKLRQILLSLLSNAVKFTSEGSIDVEVGTLPGTASVCVTDTGPGMDTRDLGRIFEPFVQLDSSTTRRHGGTGLGLFVSRDLARLLGGDIAVTSAPGEGSMFSVRFPVDLIEDGSGRRPTAHDPALRCARPTS